MVNRLQFDALFAFQRLTLKDLYYLQEVQMKQEAQALPQAVRDFITPGHKKMLIGGKWVEAASGKTFVTVNPATAEPLATVAEGDAEDIERAVKAARKAFDEGPWPHEKPA